jgi:hypothetical protein
VIGEMTVAGVFIFSDGGQDASTVVCRIAPLIQKPARRPASEGQQRREFIGHMLGQVRIRARGHRRLAAAVQFGGRGQFPRRRPQRQPPPRQQHPRQLIITQPAQPPTHVSAASPASAAPGAMPSPTRPHQPPPPGPGCGAAAAPAPARRPGHPGQRLQVGQPGLLPAGRNAERVGAQPASSSSDGTSSSRS